MQWTYWQTLLFGAILGIAFGIWLVKDDWSANKLRYLGALTAYALMGAVAGAVAGRVISRTKG
jgi:hypothetical protein